MADRYPMIPTAFPPGMAHQQQMSQAQHLQHQQQDPHSNVPGFPDQGPLWQQMQQIQTQLRPQSAGMDPAHVNPQVAELMRNQQLARQQSQQQQQQQQFGMGVPQMGGQPGGPQGFLDPSNQQQPSQSHPGFQNMGISNPSLQTLNNRTAMLHAMQQQPNSSAAQRQLELMGLAHNQQPQNAHNQQPQNSPLNFAHRMQQQALNNQPGMSQAQPQQSENFLSPSMANSDVMRRASPSHPAQQPGGSQGPNANGQPLPQVNRASFLTLQERASNLKNIITAQENQLVQLTSQRARIGDASFMDKVRSVSADLKNRKEHYGRLLNFLHQIQSQMNNGAMNGGGMGMPLPPQQNGMQAGQPSWMQAGPSQQPQTFNPNGQQQNGQQGAPQGHPQNGHMQNHPAIPPRSGPSQQQFPNPMQSGTPFQQMPQGQEGRLFPPIPPLDKARFDTVYKNFCVQRNLVHSARMMSVEARPIDLYDLHTHVMLEGGGANVSQKDMWAVIGGRMGFVSFPASETEPAKAGPGVAQHLAHVYKEYLMQFDNVYVSTVMESRRKNDALTAARGMAGAASGPPPLPMRLGGITDPNQMQLVMAYANVPAAELRRRGLPDQIIQFIEANRVMLLQRASEQANFRNQIARPPDQGGMHPGGQFGGSPPNAGGMSGGMMPGRQFMSHPGMQGNALENQQQSGPGITRPSREHVQAAMAYISKLKSDYNPERMMSSCPPIDVPAEQRMEYNTFLEQLHRACSEMDLKLPMIYAVLKKEDVVRRLVVIVQTAVQQRALISSGSTRFLVTLDTLKTMLSQVNQMMESFASMLQGLMNKPNGMGMPPSMRPPPHNQQPVPPPLNAPPIPQANLPPQQQPQPPNRPPINLRPPPTKRVASAPSPTPPPVASASTPGNNAATPRDMSSPQATPKSPKGKAKPKPAPKRRPSIKNAAPPPPPPPVEPATAPSPAGSNKRAREEESSPPQHHGQPSNAPGSSVANEPSPPKRQKKEWEGPPNEAIKARAEQVENIKTEEDGAAFLEQMTELFKMAAGNDGQDSLTSDFSETLDTIFKGFGAPTDEGASGMSSLGMGDGSAPQDGAPPVADEFVEFFDFSSFETISDAGSKAATPDLISSSSTNPSPESNSEADAAHQALTSSDVKSEDFTDHLRLGVWKEVDGGESAYFHSGQWKWDSPMQSLDQPWAIFNS
ncbi:hypothetical protein B0H15DRAFT_809422 [Mycena belliarum]|uniref:ARID domain-containing protein n=1 Tax=Mycena belliarum TaxID=1033014 RepID=A0AAD6XWQ2_9AGAR|nr:hypothetical protein B0H15DRAFT_809422 [Mycena belliae]